MMLTLSRQHLMPSAAPRGLGRLGKKERKEERNSERKGALRPLCLFHSHSFEVAPIL